MTEDAKKEAEDLAKRLHTLMDEMSGWERYEVMEALLKGFCRHCGDNTPCWCMADD